VSRIFMVTGCDGRLELALLVLAQRQERERLDRAAADAAALSEIHSTMELLDL